MEDTHWNEVEKVVKRVRELENLAGCAYLFVGAHAIEDDELLSWLDALSLAEHGKKFKTDGLLPYTLPQDRPRTCHDRKTCKCYGCSLERISELTDREKVLTKWLTKLCDSLEGKPAIAHEHPKMIHVDHDELAYLLPLARAALAEDKNI